MKKFISLLLTVAMLFTTASVFAADVSQKDYPQKFWDVPKDHWAFNYIAELVRYHREVAPGIYLIQHWYDTWEYL